MTLQLFPRTRNRHRRGRSCTHGCSLKKVRLSIPTPATAGSGTASNSTVEMAPIPDRATFPLNGNAEMVADDDVVDPRIAPDASFAVIFTDRSDADSTSADTKFVGVKNCATILNVSPCDRVKSLITID